MRFNYVDQWEHWNHSGECETAVLMFTWWQVDDTRLCSAGEFRVTSASHFPSRCSRKLLARPAWVGNHRGASSLSRLVQHEELKAELTPTVSFLPTFKQRGNSPTCLSAHCPDVSCSSHYEADFLLLWRSYSQLLVPGSAAAALLCQPEGEF